MGDVDDFAFDDLATHGMSAVNPDYFMALRFTEQAYMEGVDLLAAVQKNPSRTAVEIHRMLGRRHPRLVTQFAGAYGPVDHGRVGPVRLPAAGETAVYHEAGGPDG